MKRSAKINKLKELAASDDDRGLIDRIEEIRQEILKGRAPIPLQDCSPREILHLNGLAIALRMDFAPASIDTLIDIFVDQVHRKLPGFSGRGEGKLRVLDIGANEGFYTLAMKVCNPQAEIIAVEASAQNFELLTDNIGINQISGIHCIQAAVTDREQSGGKIRLQSYPGVSTVASTDISRLHQSWIDPGKIRTEEVPSITLDELAEQHAINATDPLDILKIDAEGAELEILKGGEAMLPYVRRVVVEWHSRDLREAVTTRLVGMGFEALRTEEEKFGDSYFRARWSERDGD